MWARPIPRPIRTANLGLRSEASLRRDGMDGGHGPIGRDLNFITAIGGLSVSSMRVVSSPRGPAHTHSRLLTHAAYPGSQADS